MTDKTLFTAEDASTAAIMIHIALVGMLVKKGVFTTDEGNFVFATAVSSSHANGSPKSAALIEAMAPTAKGVDVIAMAQKLGFEVTRA